MRKRILSLTLSLAMVISLFAGIPVTATESANSGTRVELTAENTATTLKDGITYFITQNLTINSSKANKNGLVVAEGATATISIPEGTTLTVYGKNGSGTTGGGAAILLPEGATLIVIGNGKLVAVGGNAGNGAQGGTGGNSIANDDTDGHYESTYGSTQVYFAGDGGRGGNGGGGAGAGIGTNGGSGGSRSNAGSGWRSDGIVDSSRDGNSGSSGGAGSSSVASGDFICASTIDLSGVAGGSSGSAGSAGARGTNGYDGDDGDARGIAGGAGGGGGGGGYAGAAVGTGGGGGGQGGGGASAGYIWGGRYVGGGGGGGGQGAGTARGGTYGSYDIIPKWDCDNDRYNDVTIHYYSTSGSNGSPSSYGSGGQGADMTIRSRKGVDYDGTAGSGGRGGTSGAVATVYTANDASGKFTLLDWGGSGDGEGSGSLDYTEGENTLTFGVYTDYWKNSETGDHCDQNSFYYTLCDEDGNPITDDEGNEITGPLTIDSEGNTSVTLPEGMDAGKYTINVGSTESNQGELPVSGFEIAPRVVTNPTFDGLEESYFYDDGNEIKPAFILKDENDNIIPDSEYSITYTNNIVDGEATITITDNPGGNFTVSGSKNFTIKPKIVTFNVSDTEYTYETGVEREISFTPSILNEEDFEVKYYLVDENNGVLYSTTPEDSAITAGKYLYVIDFVTEKTGYAIEDAFKVESTSLPTQTHENCGYMYIKVMSGSLSQKPIYFTEGTVNLKVNDTYTNVLINENGTTPTFTSSNTSVATVDSAGNVTAVGKGTATIMAKSEMSKTTPVYASYTINVGLATKTLTADDFIVTANDKAYNASKDVTISATVKSDVLYAGDNIKVDITGFFTDENAGDKTVNYTITGISGIGAENYVLESNAISGTTTAKIEKAKVTIICAATTTRTYDGTPQSVDVSAMANGAIFDSASYIVKYNGGEVPSGVGSFTVTVELTTEVSKNYEIAAQPNATLIIKSAIQEVFSVEGIPETVYYGDSFTLSAEGTSGTVTYEITSGEDVATLDGADVTVTGVGKVTIVATSVNDGHTDRIATKSFNAKKRILTPQATAENRTYNGENGVDVILSLAGLVNSDIVTATGTGTMLTADAGENKIVYVSGITLDGAQKELYTLETSSVQTTVDIAKKEITAITVSASDKKYDGTDTATATVTSVEGVIPADAGQVDVIGSAVFANSDSEENKTVTFTASSLAGAKAINYYIDGTLTAETTADISPVAVNFVVGQTTFVYDGNDKVLALSASDEFGRIFTQYDVDYDTTPNEAGSYTATVVLDDSVNYTTTQGEITVTISEVTQDNLVIVGLPGTIQYGDSFTLEAVGGEDGGSYEWTVKDNADVTLSTDTEATTTVTIGDVVGDTVEIEVVKKTANYEDILAKVVFVPTAKVVTFDISNLEQTYDGSEKEIDVDTQSGVTYDVEYNNSYDLPTEAGTYNVKVEANGNYSGMQTAILTIKKAAATGEIVGLEGSYTYGDTITGISVSNLQPGTNANITYAGTGIYIPQSDAPAKVGNYSVIAEITGDNYETYTVTESFVIEKKVLTVKADNTTRAYGEANPIFTLSYTGFVNGETKDVLLAEPIATASANASSGVGKYDITVSGGNAENYTFSYDNTGKLTVTSTAGSLYITGSTNTVYVNDVFGLHAFYGNSKLDVDWISSNSAVAEIAANGTVTAKSQGTVTITATADANYGNATATFELTVKPTSIILVPTGLVKTYTGEKQDITFANNADFTPVLSGEGKNVDVTYTLISDPSVTEPIQAGTYSVVYTISDDRYTGGGNTTMYINKAEIEVKPKNITKVYGDDPVYELETTSTLISADDLAALAANTTFTCEGAPKTAIVKDGGYEITATLNTTENENLKFFVDGTGTLTVAKAPLLVKVKDVTRVYGAENPTLEVEYEGFKNEETESTENIFTGELVLTYDASITAELAVGTYEDKASATGIESANYEITFVPGDVVISRIGVAASAGTSRSSYLTVKFDKAVEGLGVANFVVKNGEEVITITSVTASNDNKTYTLNGSFSTSVTYTVTPNLTGITSESTHEITTAPLSITPTRSGGGGGGGSSAPTTYTVKFETNKGSKIDSVKVEKNNTVDEPAEPTKDGYTFNGWYTDKELTKAYDFTAKVTKGFTLYAKWTEIEEEPKDDDSGEAEKWVNPFIDVKENDWYYSDVKYAVENGLFSGTSESTFDPEGIITRAMMVTVLYRAEGEPAVNRSIPFEDIDMGSYYANAVIWAQQNGIVNGISETVFAPDSNISREQIAAIIFRYAAFKGYDVSVGEDTNILSYDDAESISEYAIAAMQYACGSSLINGKTQTTLNPLDNATRAEIAAILHRFIEGNK